jgi:carbon storage regulator
MLVLSRKLNEVIVINGNIRITIVEIRRSRVSVSIEAPDDVTIRRLEQLQKHGDDEDCTMSIR